MRRDRVDDAIGAHLLGVIREHRHTCLNTGLDDHPGDLGEVAIEHQSHFAKNCRNGRAECDAGDFTSTLEQAAEGQRDFVGGGARIGLGAPGARHALALEQADHRVRIAHIDC